MSDPSISLHSVETVRGRVFVIEESTWPGGGVSYDVSDKATALPLHNESFDTVPTPAQIEDLLQVIVAGVNGEGWPFGDKRFFEEGDYLALLSGLDGFRVVRVELDPIPRSGDFT